jgi:hypothetical protein
MFYTCQMLFYRRFQILLFGTIINRALARFPPPPDLLTASIVPLSRRRISKCSPCASGGRDRRRGKKPGFRNRAGDAPRLCGAGCLPFCARFLHGETTAFSTGGLSSKFLSFAHSGGSSVGAMLHGFTSRRVDDETRSPASTG